MVLGLGGGLQKAGTSLAKAKASATAAAAGMLTELVEHAAQVARDAQAPLGERTAAVRLLGCSGSGQTAEVLVELVDPAQPETLQLAALETLGALGEPPIAHALVAVWQRATPNVQEAIIATLAARSTWAGHLLDACAAGAITPAQISSSTRTALLNHRDAELRARAEKLFAAAAGAAGETIARYQSALALPGDPARGDQVYQRECMACHQLGQRGFQVGPNLALVRNRTDAAMLEAILDPNREVQPSYVNYIVLDDSGRTITGMIVADTATSITLARDKGASETVLKQNLDEIKSTGKSLMPEGLDKNISPQQMADLLAFLKQIRYDVGTLPDFVQPED
jgi:putative heme-binding domain-containing protein